MSGSLTLKGEGETPNNSDTAPQVQVNFYQLGNIFEKKHVEISQLKFFRP